MDIFLEEVKKASRIVANLSGKVKNKFLNDFANRLEKDSKLIQEANQKDIEYARNNI